jgi:hypothetical protein
MGYRIVRVSREPFEQMFAEGWTCPDAAGRRVRCTKGLPLGARLVAVSMDHFFLTGDVALKFEHPSRPPDGSGGPIPVAAVVHTAEPAPGATPEAIDRARAAQFAGG